MENNFGQNRNSKNIINTFSELLTENSKNNNVNKIDNINGQVNLNLNTLK